MRESGRAPLTAGILAVCALAACAPDAESPTSAPEEPARNLLFISIDTLRADHLSGYGYARATTPFLDELASGGTLFVNAISPASWTVPAHVTMLTGLQPEAHGLLSYPRPGRLSPSAVTLAEVLRDAGFRTGAFTGGGFMSRKHGIRQGFDVFHPIGLRFHTKFEVVLRWLQELPRDERFFVFLHGFDVHGPYRPPAPYDREFAGNFTGEFDTNDFTPDRERPELEVLEYVVSQYDGEIRAADAGLREFFAKLEARGLLENTLVVVTSDHGEELYEHGSIEHTHSLYDELVRVPLIFSGPNIPAARVASPVGLVDLYPTLLERLGVDIAHDVQGARLFERFPPESRPQFSFVDFTDFPYRLASVRTEEWKLIEWTLSGMAEVDLSRGEPERYTHRFSDRHEDFVELFHLPTDPQEREDVAEANPDVVAGLLRLLQEHRAESAALEQSPAEAFDSGPEYLEALEALGYVDGD